MQYIGPVSVLGKFLANLYVRSAKSNTVRWADLISNMIKEKKEWVRFMYKRRINYFKSVF